MDEHRQRVEQAAAELDHSATRLLPGLVPGEAILMGVDFPVPVSVRITPPTARASNPMGHAMRTGGSNRRQRPRALAALRRDEALTAAEDTYFISHLGGLMSVRSVVGQLNLADAVRREPLP